MYQPPKPEFGTKLPDKTREKVRWILKKYPEIMKDKTSNLLILAYWRTWDKWDMKAESVSKLTPLESITRARRETKL